MQYNSIHAQSPIIISSNEPRQPLSYQQTVLNSQKKSSYQEKAVRVMKNSGIWNQQSSQSQLSSPYTNETNVRNNISTKNISSNRNLGTPNFLLSQSSQLSHNNQKRLQNFSLSGATNQTNTANHSMNLNKGIFVPSNGSTGQRNSVEMVKSSIYGLSSQSNERHPSQLNISLNNGANIQKMSSGNFIGANSNANPLLKSGHSQNNHRALMKPMKNSAILSSTSEQNQNINNGSFNNGFPHYNPSQQSQTTFNFHQNKLGYQTSIKKKAYYKGDSHNPNVTQFLLSSPKKINQSFDSQTNISKQKNTSVDAINQYSQKATRGSHTKQFKNLIKLNRYVQSPSFKKTPISLQQMSFLSQKSGQKPGFSYNSPVREKQDFISAPPSTPFLQKKNSNEKLEMVSNNIVTDNKYQLSASKKNDLGPNRIKRSTSNSNQNELKKYEEQKSNIRRSSIQDFKSSQNSILEQLNKAPSILQKMAKVVTQQAQQVAQGEDVLDNIQDEKSNDQRAVKGCERQIGLQDFCILRHLGTGKYGKVYLVREKQTNFICALKQIEKRVLHQEQITEQFIRQLKIQTFISHPNIIKMYGFFQDQQNIYIILQAGTGGQLYHLLKKMANTNPTTAGLPESKVAYYMRQICQAVKQLHTHQIIHRDIKPQNIVVHDNVIKLCDFGWSVRQDSKLRTTFCGTPLYVCPEILKGKQYDQKIDIWSLGVMMYQMVIGQNPFKITKEQELIKIVKDQVKIPPYAKITKDMENLLAKCLKKNPSQRAFIRQLIDHQFFKKHPDKQMEKNRMAGLC